jgi:hypothetical protein
MKYDYEVKRMAEEHTKFLIGLLETTNGVTLRTCEYLCNTVFIHSWKHCKEDILPARANNGKFLKKS